MKTCNEIIDKLTPDAMVSRLSLTKHSIARAKDRREMPASWFVVVDAMCIEKGIHCPRDFFSFKADTGGADQKTP